MNYILAVILFAIGVACIAWCRTLARINAEFMARRFEETYGSFAVKMRWDDPKTWQTMSYVLGVIGVGLFFISLAWICAFGTIRINL